MSRPYLQHQCRHAVTEHVAGGRAIPIFAASTASHQVAQGIQAKRFAGIRQKHHVIVRFHHKLRPRFTDAFIDPGRRSIADHGSFGPTPLSTMDNGGATGLQEMVH
jgi:hypothetical protein